MATLSPILDVIIGMAGVYVAFSLLASWGNERVAAALNLRGQGLVNGIYQILNGDSSAFTKFVNDPMFQSLQQAADKSIPPAKTAATAVATPAAVAKTAPSYLSSKQFSTILVNMLTNAGARIVPGGGTTSADAAVGAAVGAAAGALAGADAGAGAGSDAGAAAGAAAGAVAGADAKPVVVTNALATVQDAADKLGMGPEVKALLAKSGGDYDKFVAGAETLFDDHMDRVSGWYKRKSHTILFAIGALLALFFNIDSIRLYQGLTCNSALRGAVTTATAVDANGKPVAGPNAAVVQGLLQAIPLGWARWPSAQPPDDPIACTGTTASAAAPWSGPGQAFGYFVLKVLGIAITTVALSLGAPFWFDALSRLTNVRSAGKKPQTSAAAAKA